MLRLEQVYNKETNDISQNWERYNYGGTFISVPPDPVWQLQLEWSNPGDFWSCGHVRINIAEPLHWHWGYRLTHCHAGFNFKIFFSETCLKGCHTQLCCLTQTSDHDILKSFAKGQHIGAETKCFLATFSVYVCILIKIWLWFVPNCLID